MRITKLFLSIVFCVISSLSFAKNQLVYFEPNQVELTGVIKILKFPGAPNYESIKKGDAVETGAYLILDNPINVVLPPKTQSDTNTPEKNIKMLQLVVENKSDWNKLKEGSRVRIEGTLFHALTGHHHTRILLTVKAIRVISK